MNRCPHRILLPALLLLALLSGSCSEDEDPSDNLPPDNQPPVIQSLTADRDTAYIPVLGVFNPTITLVCSATDPDYDPLDLQWSSLQGSFPEGTTGFSVVWRAPPVARSYWIHVRVEDGTGVVRDSLRITVMDVADLPDPPEVFPPVARFTVDPPVGDTDTEFKFDATSSTSDSSGSARLEARWDWDADGVWDTDWSLWKKAAHRFGQVGLHEVRLEVRDPAGRLASVGSSMILDSALPSVPIGMITVPPGPATIGEEDVLPVLIEHTFELSRTEVTNAQYLEVLNWALDQQLVSISGEFVFRNNRRLVWMPAGSDLQSEIRYSAEENRFHLAVPTYVNGAYGPGLAYPDGYDPADHPVVCVTWFGAACFCDWLSLREGLPPYYNGNWSRQDTDGTGYRLPLPNEWEYAARFGDGRLYPWGDQLPDCQLAEYNPDPPCSGWTSPVGSHPEGASVLGFQDHAGNAKEWVNSFRLVPGSSYDYEYARVRGGNHYSNAVDIRTTRSREFWLNGPEVYTSGFRVCRTVP